MAVIWTILRENGIFKKNNKKQKQETFWLKSLFITFAVILILQLAIFIVYNILLASEICIILTGVFFTTTFLFINNLTFFGLSKSTAFEYKLKYESTPIDKETQKKYIENLKQILSEKRVYTDPLINLDKLAKIVNIPKHQLSRIINENFGLSFNDLINHYRIEEVKKIINEGKKDNSIIEIAYQVGYNSKSTFNTAFKKHTKMTPSAYIESIYNTKNSIITI